MRNGRKMVKSDIRQVLMLITSQLHGGVTENRSPERVERLTQFYTPYLGAVDGPSAFDREDTKWTPKKATQCNALGGILRAIKAQKGGVGHA